MNQNKIPATIRILTLNSEKVLRRCLESCKDFDEILIFDGNSTDKTLQIAGEFGARIEKQFPGRDEPNIPITDWAEMVTRALYAAKYDWVFYLDSDEAMPQGLVEEIRTIVMNPQIEYYVYKIPNRIIYLGREILYATPYPGYQKRLLNRKCGARYEKSPHYHLIYDEKKYKTGATKNPWYVYIDQEEEPLKKRFIILEALDSKSQNWRQFLYWSIWKKLGTALKIFVKITFMYARHGFKHTLPFRMEFLRVQNKLVLTYYLIRMRIFGQDIEKLMPRENI